MKINEAEYIKSSPSYKECPKGIYPEYAFIGRSNVGKSSLINAICERRKLAKTSGQPGKTQYINHFLINERIYFADLPGYGFAKVSQAKRKEWKKMIENYLLHRNNLVTTFILIDARIEPQENDIQMINWMGNQSLPIALVFTKRDKITTREWDRNFFIYQKKLKETWEEIPPYFITSAEKNIGTEDLVTYIFDTSKLFKPIM